MRWSKIRKLNPEMVDPYPQGSIWSQISSRHTQLSYTWYDSVGTCAPGGPHIYSHVIHFLLGTAGNG